MNDETEIPKPDPKENLRSKKKPKIDTDAVLVEPTANEDDSTDEDLITDDPLEKDYFDVPGALRGTSELVLETRKAQLIFEGRKPDRKKNKPFIIGLNSFAGQMRIIYDASGEGDPYADYWLIKVERSLEEKLELFDAEIKKYTQVLGQFENINHEVAHSIKPITKTLRFSIAYSYQGATMLMKLDQLIRTILTANHVGLVATETASNDVRLFAKKARSTFETAVGYRYCDINRDDIAANNPKAQKAQELMGACPFDILDDVIAPKFVSSKAMFLKSKRLKNYADQMKK